MIKEEVRKEIRGKKERERDGALDILPQLLYAPLLLLLSNYCSCKPDLHFLFFRVDSFM